MFLLQEIHPILCRSLPHLIGLNRIHWPHTTDYWNLPSSLMNPPFKKQHTRDQTSLKGRGGLLNKAELDSRVQDL